MNDDDASGFHPQHLRFGCIPPVFALPRVLRAWLMILLKCVIDVELDSIKHEWINRFSISILNPTHSLYVNKAYLSNSKPYTRIRPRDLRSAPLVLFGVPFATRHKVAPSFPLFSIGLTSVRTNQMHGLE